MAPRKRQRPSCAGSSPSTQRAYPLSPRAVALGNYILSEADNWYVPSRLTPEMNQALETTKFAFGRAVQAQRF
jgi:hypothetical protein